MSSAEGNPAVYLPGASCTLAGRTFSPCSSTANTAQRRILSLENPVEGPKYANIVVIDDGGTRQFDGLLLSVQRRHSSGLTVQANYTLGHCIDYGPIFDISGPGRTTPDRLGLEKGNCDLDRRHIFNLSTVYQVPRFSNNVLRTIAGGWRVSGIVGVLSGSYLTVTSGLDNALNGFGSQRPNQVLASPYTATKNNQTWLNPAAFAQPENGTFGNMGRANILGPGSIRIDMGLTREFRLHESHLIEFRAEAFNLPNHLNAGNPATNLSTTATFGLIRSAADPTNPADGFEVHVLIVYRCRANCARRAASGLNTRPFAAISEARSNRPSSIRRCAPLLKGYRVVRVVSHRALQKIHRALLVAALLIDVAHRHERIVVRRCPRLIKQRRVEFFSKIIFVRVIGLVAAKEQQERKIRIRCDGFIQRLP